MVGRAGRNVYVEDINSRHFSVVIFVSLKFRLQSKEIRTRQRSYVCCEYGIGFKTIHFLHSLGDWQAVSRKIRNFLEFKQMLKLIGATEAATGLAVQEDIRHRVFQCTLLVGL